MKVSLECGSPPIVMTSLSTQLSNLETDNAGWHAVCFDAREHYNKLSKM